MANCVIPKCSQPIADGPIMCTDHWLQLTREQRFEIIDCNSLLQRERDKNRLHTYQQAVKNSVDYIVFARARATMMPTESGSHVGTLCEGHIPPEDFFRLIEEVTGEPWDEACQVQFLYAIRKQDDDCDEGEFYYDFVDGGTEGVVPITYVTD